MEHQDSSRDEAVRDLKRSLSKQDEKQSKTWIRQSTEPLPNTPLLHEGIGRLRDVAQPGGFRREHIIRKEPGASSAPSLARTPLMQTIGAFTDPRYHLLEKRNSLAGRSGLDAEDDLAIPPPAGGSSSLATVLVILKSTVGGTLMVIPNGFKDAGLLLAPTMLSVIGVIEIFCMVLLVHCSKELNGATYGQIARHALGSAGSWAVEVSLVMSQFGFVCAEMLYVGKNCHGALLALGMEKDVVPSVTVVLLLQLILVVPMSWIRKLKYFQVTNAIANATVLFALSVLMAFAVGGIVRNGPGPAIETVGSKSVLFAGTAVFSFECINFVVPMYDAHEEKETFIPILVVTLLGVVVLFIFFGCVNYICYGVATDPVVTLNLPPDSLAGKSMPLAFALASLFNVPLFLFPASTLIEDKIFAIGPPSLKRKWKKNVLRTVLVLLCAGFSIVGADSIDALVSVVGSFCCVPLAFIYPVIFHIQICKPGVASIIAEVCIGCLGVVLFVCITVVAVEDF